MASWFGLLFLACVASGMGVVQMRHHTQALFGELQVLQMRQRQLQTDWEELTLQRSSLANIQVAPRAQQKLQMRSPNPTEVVHLNAVTPTPTH